MKKDEAGDVMLGWKRGVEDCVFACSCSKADVTLALGPLQQWQVPVHTIYHTRG